MIVFAPAKLNLCLYLGPARPDGLHELCSLFEPLALADRIEVSESDRDEVVCRAVEGPNLAALALNALRERGFDRSPLRIEIEKRIPVAAGLGGGSADAAAVLRLAGGDLGDLADVAAGLGADVPSQLDPRLSLVRGAGERIEPLPRAAPHAVALVPLEPGLATAETFAEADRLGIGRDRAELDAIAARLREAAAAGVSPLRYPELLVNDLQEAAVSLRPEIGEALRGIEEAGAARGLVAGSGPTAFGLFADLPAAQQAAERLASRWPGALAVAAGEGPR